jgi:hypothetical protein
LLNKKLQKRQPYHYYYYYYYYYYYPPHAQAWWCTPVVPDNWEEEIEGSWSEAILGKVSTTPYLKNKLKTKGLGCGSSGRAPA